MHEQLIALLDFETISLHHDVNRVESWHEDLVEAINSRDQGVGVALEVLNKFWQDLEVLEELIFRDGLDDQVPVLREEEKAPTLAARLVLLPLVGLKNLSRVVLGLETLEQALHLEPVKPPEVTENFWSVGLHFHIGLDCSCWILVEILKTLQQLFIPDNRGVIRFD